MKTAISLPDALFAAAEAAAERLGVSRSELYARAIRAYLERVREEGVTEQLDRVYGGDGGDGGDSGDGEDAGDGIDGASKLDELLARMQSASLPREDW